MHIFKSSPTALGEQAGPIISLSPSRVFKKGCSFYEVDGVVLKSAEKLINLINKVMIYLTIFIEKVNFKKQKNNQSPWVSSK